MTIKLRKHQIAALRIADNIAQGLHIWPASEGKPEGRPRRVVTAGITPGGGKTLMASLFANQLADEDLVDRVLVVVPNDSLKSQMVKGFYVPVRGLHRALIADGVQRTLPGTGKPFGKVVTYQALLTQSKDLARWCAERKTLVIYDEVHHLCSEQDGWRIGAEMLVDASEFALCMSGTLWRWDEGRIPIVNYDGSRPIVDIQYSRAEALDEQAIILVDFHTFDGDCTYERYDVEHNTVLSEAEPKEESRALNTALESRDYLERVLTDAMNNWLAYRDQKHASSVIVVCKSQRAARQADRFIRSRFTKHRCGLAISDEPGANKAIAQFVDGSTPILVTVKKAYEGLDVPNATHLIYLSNVRSVPFLDQVVARVTRYNPLSGQSWDSQVAHVHVPFDPAMRRYIATMNQDQTRAVREREERAAAAVAHARRGFRVIGAEVTDISTAAPGSVPTAEENIGLRRLEQEFPETNGLTHERRLVFAYRMHLVPAAHEES